jgi:translation initiation factor IF-3
MKKSRHRPIKKIQIEEFPLNEKIKVPEVRLIDEEGQFIDVLPSERALEIARERGLDLVLVSPKANPPVAKIMDYGRFQYQQEKEMRKQKAGQKKVEVKGIRLSPRIGDHDIEVRLNQAKEFLNNGDKVKIEIILKGRERQHTNLARELINNFIQSISQEIAVRIEEPISAQGGQLMTIIAKK